MAKQGFKMKSKLIQAKTILPLSNLNFGRPKFQANAETFVLIIFETDKLKTCQVECVRSTVVEQMAFNPKSWIRTNLA